jgi:hypothetical protein
LRWLCAVASIGYAWIDVSRAHNGGSWYGYTLGTIGAALIVWLRCWVSASAG